MEPRRTPRRRCRLHRRGTPGLRRKAESRSSPAWRRRHRGRSRRRCRDSPPRSCNALGTASRPRGTRHTRRCRRRRRRGSPAPRIRRRCSRTQRDMRSPAALRVVNESVTGHRCRIVRIEGPVFIRVFANDPTVRVYPGILAFRVVDNRVIGSTDRDRRLPNANGSPIAFERVASAGATDLARKRGRVETSRRPATASARTPGPGQITRASDTAPRRIRLRCRSRRLPSTRGRPRAPPSQSN